MVWYLRGGASGKARSRALHDILVGVTAYVSTCSHSQTLQFFQRTSQKQSLMETIGLVSQACMTK